MAAKKKQKLGGRPSAGEASSSTSVWLRHACRIAALWIVSFAAYSNSFDSGLVFDNAAIIGHDARIRAATPESVRLIFTKEYWYPATNSGLYRPLTTLSYLWNYAVLEDGPQTNGYHLVNLALHDVNILLVYALGCMILGGTPALALAALWALHPLLTESVTNIVGRADLLAAFGVLAGIACYIRYSKGEKPLAWLIALGGAQFMGLFSKESGLILPAVMILYDVTRPRRQAWRDRILPYLAVLIPIAAFVYLRWHIDTHLVVRVSENALVGAGFWTQRITAIKVIGKFLWLFVWPARLSADYSFNAVPLFGWQPWRLEDAKALIALASCAGLIAVAIRFRRVKPLCFFVGLFFVALAPTSNLVFPIGSIMAERFMYLPSLALCGCVVIAIGEVKLARQWIKWTALGAVCLAFGMRTYARNFDWHDNASLWSSAAEAYPECARAHYNLGDALMEGSDIPDAIAQFQAALRVRPDYANAHISLANALARDPGKMPDAIAQYEAALRIDPNTAMAHYNLGTALARTPGRMPDAIAEWQKAIRIQPDFAEAHYNLGIVYAQSPDRLPEAVIELQAALHARPDYADAHINLGNVLSSMPGHLSEAIAQYQEAIRLRPDVGETHYRLGMALLQVPGRGPDAIAELEAALRIKPDPQGQRMVDELRAHLH